MNNFIKIIITSLLLHFTDSYAQYSEYFKFTDVRYTMVYDIALSKLIIEDTKLLQNRKVKEVKTIDAAGNTLKEFSVNEKGLITDFSTYEYENGQKINYDIKWEISPSGAERISSINYKELSEHGINIAYSFNYKGEKIDFISAAFPFGLSEDYIFSFARINGEEQPDKILYKDKFKDTVYMTINFRYDDKGNIMGTYQEGFDSAIDTIYYDENNIFIDHRYYDKHQFALDKSTGKLRLAKEIITYPQKQPRAAVYSYKTEVKDIVTTINYYYKDNGLIDYTESGSGGSNQKIIYQYQFYE